MKAHQSGAVSLPPCVNYALRGTEANHSPPTNWATMDGSTNNFHAEYFLGSVGEEETARGRLAGMR